MKIIKNLTLALILFLPVISGCYFQGEDGPPGPQGPQGPTGPQGEPGESGYIFEYEQVSFTGPDYELFLSYPTDFEGYDSDAALVYFLWDVQEDGDGNPVEVWRQLAQTVLLDQGTLVYNFDHTKIDVRLFLQGDFDLNTLTAIDTDDWIVRIVVVPANYWSRISVDYSDYYAVKEAFGLPELKKHNIATKRRDL